MNHSFPAQVQAAILAALGDVDRSVRALACGVAVAALLCVDAYVSSPAADLAGMVAAAGPLRAAATVIAVVGAALQVDGVRRASLRMSGAAVARATGARPPAPGKRHPKSPGRAGARKRAGSIMAASGGLGRRPGISTFHRARDTVEVGLNIGESFSYMGRGAVYMMIGKLATLDCDVCFTVEGRADDELPEVVLGASTFSALKLSEKFANLMPPTS